MEMLNQKQKIIAIGILVIIGVAIIFQYINSTKEIYEYEDSANFLEESTTAKENKEDKKIVVHITGAVKNERHC